MSRRDPEARRAYNQTYYAANRERLTAAQRARAHGDSERRRMRSRAWHHANAERVAAQKRADYLANPERNLLRNAKSRAKKLGLDYDLSIEDIVIPEVCPVLGIPLRIGERKGWSANAPTLDRIDNSRGYVRGNIMVISWRANSLKGDATLDESERVTAYMRQHLRPPAASDD